MSEVQRRKQFSLFFLAFRKVALLFVFFLGGLPLAFAQSFIVDPSASWSTIPDPGTWSTIPDPGTLTPLNNSQDTSVSQTGRAIIVDPSAPGTTFLYSGNSTPQINIATPQSSVSHNRYTEFNVDSDGLILNNSQVTGVSRTGGEVTANPNLLNSGPATVIVNEVTGGASSTLTGTTEVFGPAADVIVANPNDIVCNGCRFLNSSTSTLTTGTPLVVDGEVSLSVSKGTLHIGPEGLETEHDGGLHGRHIVINGEVHTTNSAADKKLVVSGGSQSVDLQSGVISAAPVTTPQSSPFAIDASEMGAMRSGSITIWGTEAGLGVNLYGNLSATHDISATSQGDLFYGNLNADGSVELFSNESIRQYGNVEAGSEVSVGGATFTLYSDREIDTAGEVRIQADDDIVVAGEISGGDIHVASTHGTVTNIGFVLADDELSIAAGEAVSQQREFVTEYDVYFDPALQAYLRAYQYQLLQGGEQAEIAAELIQRASNHDVIEEHIDQGATMVATEIEVQAGDDITNTGGAIAATRDVLLSAGADIINEYLQLRRVLRAEDGCPAENCGYRIDFHAGEILAGNDLVLNSGGNIENRASDMAAGGDIRASADLDIVNSLMRSQHGVNDTEQVQVINPGVASKSICSGSGKNRSCKTKYYVADYAYNTTEYQFDEVNVLSPGRVAALYGDVDLVAGRDFVSIASEITAGDSVSIQVGEQAILSSFVDAEENFVRRSERYVRKTTNAKLGTVTLSNSYRTLTYEDVELVTATSNIVGHSISIHSGEDITLTGARLLASRNLDLWSESGSILIDSTELPDLIELKNDAGVQFIELQPDVVAQIFGHSSPDAGVSASAQSYTSFLQSNELLTAVEALRRAKSGAVIKDAARGVGVQSYVSLIDDDYLASIREDAIASVVTVFDMIETDIAAHNDAVSEYHARFREELSELTALLDASDAEVAHYIQTETEAIDAAAQQQVEGAEADYQAQLAANEAEYGPLLTKRVKVKYYSGGKNGGWKYYWVTVENTHYVNLKNAADAQAAADLEASLSAIETQRLLEVALVASVVNDEVINQLISALSDEFDTQIADYAEQKAQLNESLDAQVSEAMRIAEILREQEVETEAVRAKMLAMGSAVKGAPSLAIALTEREFAELNRLQDVSIDDDGIVENYRDSEVERVRIVTETRDTGYYEEQTRVESRTQKTKKCTHVGKGEYECRYVYYKVEVPVTELVWVSTGTEQIEVEETYLEQEIATTALFSEDKDEQDAFVTATAWRFALHGGLGELSASPRSIVYSDADLTMEAAQDIYVTGAVSVAAEDTLGIYAGRRIGLLGAINSNFRLNEFAYAAFAEIGDTLQFGTLMRDPYAVEVDTDSSAQADDYSIEYAHQTSRYNLVNTVVSTGGDLILRSGEDILNFGGSVIAGGNMQVAAEGDVRNEALRHNFTLTSEHGCVSRACGGTGHDYKSAEFLSGTSLLVSAGGDVVNNGSVLSAAGSLMVHAEEDIRNSAITSQYLYYYVNRSSWFGLKRKKKRLYRAIISEGAMATEYGSLFLKAGGDITSEGSSFSAGADAVFEAGRDVALLAKSEELHNYTKKRGFSGLSYGQSEAKWNEFKTAFTQVEGDSVLVTAGRNATGVGALLFAANDVDITAGQDLTLDAHQNHRYEHRSGWSIGISFGGSDLVGSLLSGDDGREVYEAYMATNPTLAAVHQLATAKDKWATLNGLLNLGYELPALASDVVQSSAGSTTTITEALFEQLNPFAWMEESALLDPHSATDFKDFLSGITFRLGVYNARREWTESHVSQVVAGNDLLLEAESDLALVGGTVASAGRNVGLFAGDNVLVAALADSSRSTSSSWGLSLGFTDGGTTFGADLSRSSGSSRIFTNAAVTAGGRMEAMSGRDTVLLGANVKAHDIFMDVGNDLIVQSRQNSSSSQSHGFDFSVSFAGGVPTGLYGGTSGSNSKRYYTDTPTTLVAQDELSIYTGATTYLLGSAVYSETGNLDIDTGSLIFDNYRDTDKSTSGAVRATVAFTDKMDLDTARSDAAGSLAYRNTNAVTYATIGAGTIRVREAPTGFDLSKLNRDPDNLHRVLSDSGFEIEIPGLNLERWRQQVEDMANLVSALRAEVPDRVRAQGAQAVDLYLDLILDGVALVEVRQIVASPMFSEVVHARHEYLEALEHFGSDAAIPGNVKAAIALGYGILLGEASSFEGGSFTFPCDSAGGSTDCEIALDEFNEHLQSYGAADLTSKLKLINTHWGWQIDMNVARLLEILLYCAREEPEVFLEFLANEDARALIEWAGEEYGSGPEAFYVIGETIESGGSDSEINFVWKANVNSMIQFRNAFRNSLESTVEGLIDMAIYGANLSGMRGEEAQQETFEATIEVLKYIANNPDEVIESVAEDIKLFAVAVANSDPEALGHLTSGAILSLLPAGTITKILTGTKFAKLIPQLNENRDDNRAVIKKVTETQTPVADTKTRHTIWAYRKHHEEMVGKEINKLIAAGNEILNQDGKTFYFRSSSGTGRTAPDIMYRKPDGTIMIVEVKTGNAVLSKRQSEIFPQIKDGSAVLLKSSAELLKTIPGFEHVKPGMSLREAGLSDGVKIRTVKRDGL